MEVRTVWRKCSVMSKTQQSSSQKNHHIRTGGDIKHIYYFSSLHVFWKSLGQALFWEDSQWTSPPSPIWRGSERWPKRSFPKSWKCLAIRSSTPVIIPTPMDHTSPLPGRSALWAMLQGKQKDREARRTLVVNSGPESKKD